MRKRADQIVAIVLPLLLCAGVGYVVYRHMAVVPRRPAAAIPRPLPPEHVSPVWINGVDVSSYNDLPAFEQATGEQPQVVGIYVPMTAPFPAAEVKIIERSGAEPLIQMLPRTAPLADVAAGKYDAQLRVWAAALRATRHPVILSFAHEMNGSWDQWGCQHTPAPVFIAAWRHLHQVIGTADVTWLFNVNEGWTGAPCSLLSRWPGSAYVDWIGIDGYLRPGSRPFMQGLGYSIQKLERKHKPVIVAEAGASIGPGVAARMTSLFAGTRALHCLGLIYFDSATRKGDYRPQDNAASLAAFRQGLAGPQVAKPPVAYWSLSGRAPALLPGG